MASDDRVTDFFQSARELLLGHRAAFRTRLGAFTSALRSRRESARAEKRERDLHLAEDFNVFDFLRPDENCLSDIVAWLLDPRGSHGQGGAFLEHFLTVLRLEAACPGDVAGV